MSAALRNAFYLDDPQDGVSYHLLTELGVDLSRAVDEGRVPAERRSAFAVGLSEPSDVAAAKPLLPTLLSVEHAFEVPAALFAAGGSIAVDVRDSADAWLRVVLEDGDGISFAAGVHHRLVPAGSRLVTMPAFPADADRHSKLTTVVFPAPAAEITRWGAVRVALAGAAAPLLASIKQRFVPGSAEEAAGNVPHFARPGTPHTRELVAELCESFYHLGWVTGTGGSISIRHGGRIFMAPSSVQKERMQAQDIYVLDTAGAPVYAPRPLPGKKQLSLSQCSPLFQHAFSLRKAGACIHTHDVSAVLATLQNGTEWRATHQEMIKGIAGHGFLDTCVVPIIENTPHECDLADSLEEAMVRYPASNAVLVRRHGVYVWGPSWEAAKTQAECYHYLFDLSVRMRGLGIDPGATPARVEGGIGAATSYGSGAAGAGGGVALAPAAVPVAAPAAAAVPAHAGGCCGGHGAHTHAAAAGGAAAAPIAAASGFHGAHGVNALAAPPAAAVTSAGSEGTAANRKRVEPVPLNWAAVKAVVLDIEGTTTPISFVSDVLFPYAAAALEGHIRSLWGSSAELAEDVAALAALSAEDVRSGVMGATAVAIPADAAATVADASAPPAVRDALVARIKGNVDAQMSINRKSAALKGLQAHIWREGYASGALKGQVFPDTPGAIGGWVASGRKVYIYSSGSREAQRYLFASVAGVGDMRPSLSGFFDIPSAGMKTEAASYRSIVDSVGADAPSQVLFATDALAEAVAAAEAGLQVVITERPGNVALPKGHGFPVVRTLMEVEAAAFAAAAGAAAAGAAQ
jgi:methylthioribulose-1-phosphate dehydratase/2,3-diketo-5-methylthio-1-phosphopentane phosphatase